MATKANGSYEEPETETVRYRKTEHEYEVEVQARFHADGAHAFFEYDVWDARCCEFTPCGIELAFAESLRGQSQGPDLPHLHLDECVADDTAGKWLTEPVWITTGMAMLDAVLSQLSLKRVNGEYLLNQIADAVLHGRELAEEKRAVDEESVRLENHAADIQIRINHWLRVVTRIVAAVHREEYPPQGEPGKAA